MSEVILGEYRDGKFTPKMATINLTHEECHARGYIWWEGYCFPIKPSSAVLFLEVRDGIVKLSPV